MRTRSNRYQEISKREIRQNRRKRNQTQRVTQFLHPDQPHTDAEKRKELHDLYTNIKSVPSYSAKILDFLRSYETSSVHKQKRKNFKRRKVIAYYPYELCMADVAFYNSPGVVRANSGVKYILVFIDVFTKMCFVETMKDKNGITTLMALENIFRRLPDVPSNLITDVGTEFYNHYVQNFLSSIGTKHYSIKGPHKACVAERMIQTMKGRLEKYFYENKTKRYVDVLQQIIDNYNRTPHRSIGMCPVEVNMSNRAYVFEKLYPNNDMKLTPRLNLGDKVRLARTKTLFEKGYTRNWSKELYTIVSATSHGGVDFYKIEDQQGNLLPRSKYFYELNLVQRT